MPCGSLLVVDDDKTHIQIVASVLRQEGFRLRFETDASQVIEMLRWQPVDLILLDIEMPVISGIELCRQLKADPDLAGIPVIFITGRAEEDVLLEAFNVGAADYLTKPVKFEEMLARIRTHIRLRQSEQQLQHQLAFRELMLTVLAHDLRGPLSSASDYLRQMIKSPYSQIEQLARLNVLAEALESTQNLLEQTLDWARSIQ
ncbi:MAG: response regulator, partial [Candidatus Sericytochromatia bacterium]